MEMHNNLKNVENSGTPSLGISHFFNNGSTKIMGTSFPSKKKNGRNKKNTVVSLVSHGGRRGRDRPRDLKL